MIVSQSRKFIFVHIPKTGGTTVNKTLAPVLDRTIDADTHGWTARGEKLPRGGLNPDLDILLHSTAQRLRFAVGAEFYDSAFRFAFVRNPFSRAYSSYSYKRKQATNTQHRADYRESERRFIDMSFEDVIAELPVLSKKYPGFLPQTHWLPQKGMMNFLGRVENFNADLSRIWTHIAPDVPAPDEIKPQNVTTRKDEWRNMSSSCCDMIRDVYADDFKRFGYSTDINAEQPAPFPLKTIEKGGKTIPAPFRV